MIDSPEKQSFIKTNPLSTAALALAACTIAASVVVEHTGSDEQRLPAEQDNEVFTATLSSDIEDGTRVFVCRGIEIKFILKEDLKVDTDKDISNCS